jgi:hypothetical protein
MAQGERPAAAVLKQLIPKASNDMSRNHLVSLQVLFFWASAKLHDAAAALATGILGAMRLLR